jgi:beta-glucosidase-like glycosyl hydrolase
MQAVSRGWGAASAVLAAQAGCDLLPLCANPDLQVEAIEALVRASEGGEIPWAAMEDSCGRMRRLKERFLVPYRDPSPKEARAAAGGMERVVLAERISREAGFPV